MLTALRNVLRPVYRPLYQRLLRYPLKAALRVAPFPMSARMRLRANYGLRYWVKPVIAPDLSYAYFPVEKAGTSTLKRLLLSARGTDLPDAEAQALAHNASELYIARDLSETQLKRVLFGDTFRFTFVRNPYARVVSAYYNKVLDLNGNNLSTMYFAPGDAIDPAMDFPAFVDHICRHPDEVIDSHYCSQAYQSLAGVVTHDLVGRMESFDDDVARLLDRLGLDRSAYRPEHRLNTRPADAEERFRVQRKIAVTDDLAARIYRRYQEDFRLFGYDPDSYRTLD